MPLPKPKPTESKKEFISRCLRDPNINKEFKTQEQRIAVCYSIWAQEKN